MTTNPINKDTILERLKRHGHAEWVNDAKTIISLKTNRIGQTDLDAYSRLELMVLYIEPDRLGLSVVLQVKATLSELLDKMSELNKQDESAR